MSEVRFAVGDADAGLAERLDKEISAFNATVCQRPARWSCRPSPTSSASANMAGVAERRLAVPFLRRRPGRTHRASRSAAHHRGQLCRRRLVVQRGREALLRRRSASAAGQIRNCPCCPALLRYVWKPTRSGASRWAAGRSAQGLRPPRGGHDLVTARGWPQDRRPADARGRAGDQDAGHRSASCAHAGWAKPCGPQSGAHRSVVGLLPPSGALHQPLHVGLQGRL